MWREEEVLDDITTGASQDIKQATSLAKSMVTKFGMSEAVGLINYDDDSDEVFIGRDLAHGIQKIRRKCGNDH